MAVFLQANKINIGKVSTARSHRVDSYRITMAQFERIERQKLALILGSIQPPMN